MRLRECLAHLSAARRLDRLLMSGMTLLQAAAGAAPLRMAALDSHLASGLLKNTQPAPYQDALETDCIGVALPDRMSGVLCGR